MRVSGNLEMVVDSGRISRFHVVIILLCSLVAMIDGFDTQSIAFVAPEIIRTWAIKTDAFGVVFSAGLFGGLVGAILFGIASDKFGRKPALAAATILISIGSLATLFTRSIETLIAMRAITGIGLGGAVPSFIALVSEYMPKRARSTAVALMFCGFPLGAVLGGTSAAWLIPVLGWKSIFVVGGLLPLLVLPIFQIMVPESTRYLAIRGKHSEVERILLRIRPEVDWNGKFDASDARMVVTSLFSEGRAGGTLLLWAVFFLSLLMTYFLINWLPVVAKNDGVDLRTAVTSVATLNLGAVIGCVVIGRLADRIGQIAVIGSAYFLGALAICLIGQINHSAGSLYIVTFFAGALSIGAQMCTVALAAEFYETALRGTGIGWSIGVGRVGAIIGPLVGGGLIKLGYGAQLIFTFAGVASIGTALLVFALDRFVLKSQNTSAVVAKLRP